MTPAFLWFRKRAGVRAAWRRGATLSQQLLEHMQIILRPAADERRGGCPTDAYGDPPDRTRDCAAQWVVAEQGTNDRALPFGEVTRLRR